MIESLDLNQIIILVTVLAVSAAVSGFIAGLLGVGGGIIMVPALYYAFSQLGYDETVKTYGFRHLACNNNSYINSICIISYEI